MGKINMMVGATIRNFRITDSLGEGGMGVVWKATDLTLGREVALKFIAPGDDTPVARQRLLREASAASRLNHPNIITIHEIATEQDSDFIVMECVSGETLAAKLRRGPFDPDQAIDYAIQVCDALACAHRAGLVHRDLKPGNIMITAQGLLKVLDFGLVKHHEITADDVTGPAPLTMPGTALGTVPYMSPEQVSGDRLDQRSDLFSFGVVFFEMLMGQRPFGAGGSMADHMRGILVGQPPKMSRADGKPLEHLEPLVRKCLAKAPAERYQSAEEVAAELRQLRQNASLAVLTAQLEQPGSKTRKPSWLLAAAFATLLIALAIAGSLYVRRRAPGGTPDTPRTAGDQTTAAAALLERYDKPGYTLQALQTADAAIQLDPEFAPAYAVAALAGVRRSLSEKDPQRLQLALGQARKALQLNPNLALGYLASGAALLESGKLAEAATAYRKALDLDPRASDALVGLARIAARSGDQQEAERLFHHAIDAAPSRWQPRAEFGVFLFRAGRYSDAVAAFEGGRSITPDNTTLLSNLAASYHMLDRPDEEGAVLQRALEVYPSPKLYMNLGTFLFFQGKYAEALVPMEKAVELAPNDYVFWINLGDTRRWAPGERPRAAEAYLRAIQLIEDRLKTRPVDPDLRSSLALCLAKAGQTARVQPELAALRQATERTPAVAWRAAVAAEVVGDRAAALVWLGEALQRGYPLREVRNEPELISLRDDVKYHLLETRTLNAAR